MDRRADARNLKKSRLLAETIAEFRALLIERMLAADDINAMFALRAGINATDELAETLNDRVNEHAGDGADAGDGAS